MSVPDVCLDMVSPKLVMLVQLVLKVVLFALPTVKDPVPCVLVPEEPLQTVLVLLTKLGTPLLLLVMVKLKLNPNQKLDPEILPLTSLNSPPWSSLLY